MSEYAQIEIAFKNSIFSIDTRFFPQFFRNYCILLWMEFLEAIIISHAHTFVIRIFIGILWANEVAELKTDAIESLKRI